MKNVGRIVRKVKILKDIATLDYLPYSLYLTLYVCFVFTKLIVLMKETCYELAVVVN